MIEWLSQTFYEPLTQTFFQKALLGGTLVAIVCGVIGCFVILRRMAFLGDALSHAMLAGVTGGYLVTQSFLGEEARAPALLIGSIIAAIITVGMIGFISRVSRIKEDTAIGIMYTGVFAFGGILASLFSDRIHVDLLHFVMGQVLAVNDADLWVAAIVAVIVLSAVILFYRQLQLTSFDPVMAAAIGVPVVAMDYLLTTCTSFVVVSAVTMVGIILVVGLLVTPAATAYLLCNRLSRMLVVSSLFGVTSIVGGLYLSLWMNVAGGSAIVLFSTLQFLVVLMIAPEYGLIARWLRRRQMVPQQLIEDILSSILRAEGKPVSTGTLNSYVHARPEEIARALRSMERNGLVQHNDEGHRTLTEAGHREAMRLLRAHRLWETYLDHVGMPAGEIHARAHQLEHLHDEEAVDYLDAKLGHPLHDPHGKTIPEDFEHVVPGNTVKASLLREGHRATIRQVGEHAAGRHLQPGMQIRVGPRRANETIWTVLLPGGEEVQLDRQAADSLLVQVEEAS